MARVTIEDCLGNVDNRFQLVLVATKRARQILLGGQSMVEEDNDKPTVLALREIAAGHITREILTQPDYNTALDEELLEEGAEVEEGEISAEAGSVDEDLAASIAAALGEEAPEGEVIAGDATDVSDQSSEIS